LWDGTEEPAREEDAPADDWYARADDADGEPAAPPNAPAGQDEAVIFGVSSFRTLAPGSLPLPVAPGQAGRNGLKADLDACLGGWLVACAFVFGSLDFRMRIDSHAFDTAHRSRS